MNLMLHNPQAATLAVVAPAPGNRYQQEVIEYLRTENQVLKEIIKGAAIGLSNQATKWAVASVTWHAGNDWAGCCIITADNKLPDLPIQK
jgi:hypothetical protein